MLDVDNLQETNGSVKYSPSASAYFALHVKPGDKRALAYISSIIQAGDGGAPAFYQAEIFEIVWSLWNLSRTDIDLSDPEIVRTYLPYLDHVEQHWVRGRGVGWTGNSTLEDCDTTSVAYDVLSKFGRSPDIGAVLQFEDADWFRTYFHEVGLDIDERPRARCVEAGGLRQMSSTSTKGSGIHPIKQGAWTVLLAG